MGWLLAKLLAFSITKKAIVYIVAKVHLSPLILVDLWHSKAISSLA